MFGAAADRLHRSPHVTALWQQLPARRHEALGVDTSAFVLPLQRTLHAWSRTSGQMTSPSPPTTASAPPSSCASSGYNVAWIPPNTTSHPARRTPPDLVAAQRVAGVNADPDDVAGLSRRSDPTPPGSRRRCVARHSGRCRPRQHEQPTGRDDADAERQMARVHQMDSHNVLSFSSCPHDRSQQWCHTRLILAHFAPLGDCEAQVTQENSDSIADSETPGNPSGTFT